MLYNILISCFKFLFYIGSFFHQKIKLGWEGRKADYTLIQVKDKDTVWFHASSLGEFEQISYLIEVFRKTHPSVFIVVSFFSPSGYEIKKNFKYCDYVSYLPFDTKQDIQPFIHHFHPKFVVWVRYEFWYNALHILKERGTPILLLNGVFRSRTPFFYKSYLSNCLKQFYKLYVINQLSQENLSRLGFVSEVLYDTRYDRMEQIRNEPFIDSIIENFTKNHKVIICGSIWPKDDEILQKSIEESHDIKWILVPHEVHKERIQDLVQKFPTAEKYSNYQSRQCPVLIIDKIGILSKLYRYADLSYVGGGFDKVVHSLIEPLAYGRPIVIGKNIEKSEEAKEFVSLGIATQIFDENSLQKVINEKLTNENLIEKERRISLFNQRKGSTEKILSLLK